MEKVTETLKGTTEKVVSSGKTIVSKTMNLQAKDIGKKIFDNMIWVMVLIGVMILVYISYMLTQSFNIDAKIKTMNQEYKFERKISLDAPSESGNEQSFDEIKMDKHTLCDVFICSSAKSYLAGRQIFDFVSKEMFFQNVKLGARYVELDLFEDGKGNIVVSNGLFKGNWMLTLNSIYFEDFCKDISTKVFNSEYTSNYQDPFLIYLGLNLSKDKMNLVARIIKNTIEKHLVGSAYSQKGDKNILDENVAPYLEGDGGGLSIERIENNVVYINYQGACGSCSMGSTGTLYAIEGLIKRHYPELSVDVLNNPFL